MISNGDEWMAVRERLAAYGVNTVRGTVDAARAGGWTAGQVLALLDDCDRNTVATTAGPVRRWASGQVAVHLRVVAAGCSLQELKSTEAYVRAKRDRELALQREREATATAAADQAGAVAQAAADALLAVHTAEQLNAIGEELLARDQFLRRLVRAAGNGPLHRAIVMELKARSAGAAKLNPEDQT